MPDPTHSIVRAAALFLATAVLEIGGCYLPFVWLRQNGSAWLLLPAAVSLAAFAWLLTLHPSGAGRTYAAYGGAYVSAAVVWMWLIEGQRPDQWDLLGAALCLLGMTVVVLGPRH